MNKKRAPQQHIDTSVHGETVSALEAVGKVISNIVGIGAGLSAAVLVAGSAHLAIYFSAMGAPWILHLAPVSAVLQAAADPVAWTMVTALMGISGLLAAPTERARLVVDRLDTWLTRGAVAALAGYAIAAVKLDPVGFLVVAKLLATVVCVASGLSFATMVLYVASRKAAPFGFLFFQAFAGGFVLAPSMAGWAAAKCELSQNCSQLPTVSLHESSAEWRLVMAGGVFVVGRFQEDVEFQVVEPGVVSSIRQVPTPRIDSTAGDGKGTKNSPGT